MKDIKPIFLHPCGSNKTKKNDKGNIPYEIPVPGWYDNPMHRQSIIGKKICDIFKQEKYKIPIKSGTTCE